VDPDITLVGTGSEVALCVEAEEELAKHGVVVRVVSMPCWEAFATLALQARQAVIDPQIPTVSIEAGVTLGWDRYADVTLGIDRFGASAPGSEVMERLGISVDKLVAAALELLDSVEGEG
ncbi:MAG: transketolase, partial [Actinomycetia bacterium]|nr:transketolase [Actinomycetes bacterium]